MNITHPSGEPYDLHPSTEIEITRFNPFFHELGEQSIPMSLPATSRNLHLLGHPERPDNVNKLPSRLNVAIRSGSYSVIARQAILSAQRNGSIESSFYLNEGAFYEKMEDITLSEIFADKNIEFADVDAAISFMTNLVKQEDSRFAVFEVITDEYVLNELSYYSGEYYFIKDRENEEVIDDANITVPKGFYITPFVKVKHVLEEVLSHLGYTLGPSFLDIAPFNSMVFLNDNLDTIVGGSIHYVDIVPNITVKTLLDVLRKFNIEFIPDETTRIIRIVPFDHELQEQPSTDLTPYAISIPIINYSNKYKQVKLSSERLTLPSQLSHLVYLSGNKTRRYDVKIGNTDPGSLLLIEILAQYPTVYISPMEGAIVRDGIRGDRLFTERVSSLSMPYFAGGSLEAEDFSFPDVIPDIYGMRPYVGKGRTLQSKIEMQNSAGGEEEDGSQASPEQLKAMLCLYYRKSGFCVGTLYNYDNEGNRLWDYSLMWNGSEGIFEKFWRQRDNLLRNALLPISIDIILPENLKISIPATRRVSLNGQNYLLSDLRYSTKVNSTGQCSLLSTKLQNPISEAKSVSEFFRQKIYKWNIRRTYSVTGPPGRPLSYRFASEPVAFYPPDPTPAQYASGGRYFERNYTVEYGNYDRDNQFVKIGDCEMTAWLEPALY